MERRHDSLLDATSHESKDVVTMKPSQRQSMLTYALGSGTSHGVSSLSQNHGNDSRQSSHDERHTEESTKKRMRQEKEAAEAREVKARQEQQRGRQQQGNGSDALKLSAHDRAGDHGEKKNSTLQQRMKGTIVQFQGYYDTTVKPFCAAPAATLADMQIMTRVKNLSSRALTVARKYIDPDAVKMHATTDLARLYRSAKRIAEPLWQHVPPNPQYRTAAVLLMYPFGPLLLVPLLMVDEARNNKWINRPPLHKVLLVSTGICCIPAYIVLSFLWWCFLPLICALLGFSIYVWTQRGKLKTYIQQRRLH